MTISASASNRSIIACALVCAARVGAAAVERGGSWIAMVAVGTLAFAGWKAWRGR